MKRQLETCINDKERRLLMQQLLRKNNVLNFEASILYINSPVSNHVCHNRKRKTLDYTVNLRTILSPFYAGTSSIYIGLIYSAQGIKDDQC